MSDASQTPKIRIGAHVVHEGEIWTIVEMVGTDLLIKREHPKTLARIHMFELFIDSGKYRLAALAEEGGTPPEAPQP